MSEFDVADDIVKSFIVDSEACVILDITKEAEDLLAIDLTKEQIRYFSLTEMGGVVIVIGMSGMTDLHG